MSFKKDFVWGAATAAYQIEGAAFEEGKGLSVWDTCCQRTGFVKDGDNGNIACDHYHRYKEDVQLMNKMGLKAYRMSISWSRVIPSGIGKINEKGLEFYDRLVDELLENGITPYITLFHWDFPHELYKKGGWLNSDSSDWFAEYTKVVVERLSDRVKHWITLNEIQCFIELGHGAGTHAPGLKLDMSDVLLAGHNALLAHGKAVQTIRKYSKGDCEIGYAPVGGASFPDTQSKEDIEAARRATFDFDSPNIWNSSWWMDPVCLGSYPEEGLKAFEKWLPKIGADDMKTIFQPIDFLGLNIYQGSRVRMGQDGNVEMVNKNVGYDQTNLKWPVTPEILYWGPKFFYERYQKPIVITENGLSNTDWVSLDGKVHDPQRIDFLNRYLREYKRATQDGVDAKGYFQWSLMDNFEWAEGYNERFGLIHVDYQTQKRTIKDSGFWYKNVIESNGENL
ncbi:beta-glucosidase [Clostridium gelidum]|uniref:Beta-glucosidase n=1 Tax=Clostridium gelidum TaxID=704125 RepID=A0ABM7T9Z7_9CLOT|nr:GH1 family beta-glucosidase [Clostridium gelidum]BCZ48738.1 beta-glucosidase [Clostridium gelidum]